MLGLLSVLDEKSLKELKFLKLGVTSNKGYTPSRIREMLQGVAGGKEILRKLEHKNVEVIYASYRDFPDIWYVGLDSRPS